MWRKPRGPETYSESLNWSLEANLRGKSPEDSLREVMGYFESRLEGIELPPTFRSAIEHFLRTGQNNLVEGYVKELQATLGRAYGETQGKGLSEEEVRQQLLEAKRSWLKSIPTAN